MRTSCRSRRSSGLMPMMQRTSRSLMTILSMLLVLREVAPPVHEDDLPRDELALGEENHGPGDLLRRTVPLEGHRPGALLEVLDRFAGRREDEPGCNGV